jgi:hypothetical protein
MQLLCDSANEEHMRIFDSEMACLYAYASDAILVRTYSPAFMHVKQTIFVCAFTRGA